MSVDFSQPLCADFAQRVKDSLKKGDYVAFWYFLAYGKVIGSDAIHTAKNLANEWQKMSLWNQQGVLFAMVPEVVQQVQDVAQERAGLARKKEPL